MASGDADSQDDGSGEDQQSPRRADPTVQAESRPPEEYSLDWVQETQRDKPPQRQDASDDVNQTESTARYGEEPPVVIRIPQQHRRNSSEGTEGVDLDNATVMAILAHMSVMFGLPFFLIPLWQQADALSLHHARTAGAIYIFFYGLLALSTVSCGVFFPIAMLGYVPALVAIYRAIQGRSAGKWGFGHLGEWLFGWVEPESDE